MSSPEPASSPGTAAALVGVTGPIARGLAWARLRIAHGIAQDAQIDLEDPAALADELAARAAVHDTPPLVVQLYFNRTSDLAAVQAVLERLRSNGAPCLLLLERVPTDGDAGDPAPADASTLVILGRQDRASAQHAIELARRIDASRTLEIVADSVPWVLPPRTRRCVIPVDSTLPLRSIADHLRLDQVRDVVLAEDPDQNPDEAADRRATPRLDRLLLRSLFSSQLVRLHEVDAHGLLRRYEPFRDRAARILFVFPERMLPLRRAFFVRGFDVLSHLNYAGLHTDVLVFGPDNADLQHIAGALHAVAPRVHAFPLVRGRGTARRRLVRTTERRLRRLCGVKAPPPLRFEERQDIFGEDAQVAALGRVLQEHAYDVVIVTGAWFVRAFEASRPSKRPKLVCDTHDVFFVMDADSNRDELRFLYSARHEKGLELAALHACDLVLAISEADAQNLRETGIGLDVRAVSGTFEYAFRPCRARRPGPLRFGFLGSGNRNNQRSIDIIARDWWPRIAGRYPGARLLVGGTICERDNAKAFADSSPGVELLGFVGDLGEFYDRVDVVLAPIVVQGGLNFKSVEALVAGKHLITNELGARCLGAATGIRVVEAGQDITEVVEAIVATDDLEFRRASQRDALERFSGYPGLDAWLRETLAKE